MSRVGVLRAVVAAAVVLVVAPVGRAAEGWFAAFERVTVPPVERTDTGQLVEGGIVETDGFAEVVFSLAGEFKEGVPTSGVVGAVLVPDLEFFRYLFRVEKRFALPLEAKFDVRGLATPIFVSDHQTARIAFPRYRVYFYNETSSAAAMSLYVYRTR